MKRLIALLTTVVVTAISSAFSSPDRIPENHKSAAHEGELRDIRL